MKRFKVEIYFCHRCIDTVCLEAVDEEDAIEQIESNMGYDVNEL